jgi:hydroxymethylglutaryl-CoA lyase
LSNLNKESPLQLTDVTLRDGLQMESKVFSIDQKFELLKNIALCGYSRIEVTSFVNPARVPQFADAEDFSKRVYGSKELLPPLMAFVPNLKGAERASNYLYPWLSCFVSVSEKFNQANVNASIDQSLVSIDSIIELCRAKKRQVRVYVSTAFGCPYEGEVSLGTLTRVLRTVASFDPDEVALGDTIGVATPVQVREIISRVVEYVPIEKLSLHFHNTYGLGVASALAAYDLGVRKFDGSTGGVGGCPYAKGASGNVAIEDLAYAFFRQGASNEFLVNETRRALTHLAQKTGISAQGALASIWEKGGQWYGA